MIIGAYQFAVGESIPKNMDAIRRAVYKASKESVRLLVFPECALTGYPRRYEQFEKLDWHALNACFIELQELSVQSDMYLLVGSVTKSDKGNGNSAVLVTPNGVQTSVYNKRALWGWDARNFVEGNTGGIWPIDDIKVGVRICYEVRFPEYFRELYRDKTDLAVVIFNDVSEIEDLNRYDLIKANLRTRAAENVFSILSVNDSSPCQTAPTLVIDECGNVQHELERNVEGLLLYEYQTPRLNFSAQGRKAMSDILTWR